MVRVLYCFGSSFNGCHFFLLLAIVFFKIIFSHLIVRGWPSVDVLIVNDGFGFIFFPPRFHLN
jgi:hypothetical protein